MCQLHVLGAAQSKQFPFCFISFISIEASVRQKKRKSVFAMVMNAPKASTTNISEHRQVGAVVERAPPRPSQLSLLSPAALYYLSCCTRRREISIRQDIGTTTSEPRDGVHLSAGCFVFLLY